jgi:PAS domain S-box-containing protein
MRYPAEARAVIEFNGKQFAAGAAGPLVRLVSTPITIRHWAAGRVVLGYVRTPQSGTGTHSLEPEQFLADGIARIIGTGLSLREAIDALRRSEEAALSIFENADVGMCELTRSGTLVRVNRRLSRLLELPAEQLVARELTPLVHPDFQPQFLSSMEGLRNGALPRFTLELRCLRSGGGDFWGSLTITVKTSASNKPAGAIGILQDISQEVAARETLQRFNAALEAKVALRTDELEARNREVQTLLGMKTRFITVTSHEFRTPMAVAIGSADLLERHFEKLTPVKRAELLGRIKGSLQYMTALLDDILTLDRVDSGRLIVQKEALNLGEYVTELLEETRADDGGVHRLTLQMTGDASHVNTDPHLLRFILGNLLSNSLRYSPPGTEVTLELHAEAERVILAVADQGIGVPAADRQRIFEPFERGSNIGEIRGTGLGLNIVKRMALLLGGGVLLDTARERGSRFVVEFPRA